MLCMYKTTYNTMWWYRGETARQECPFKSRPGQPEHAHHPHHPLHLCHPHHHLYTHLHLHHPHCPHFPPTSYISKLGYDPDCLSAGTDYVYCIKLYHSEFCQTINIISCPDPIFQYFPACSVTVNPMLTCVSAFFSLFSFWFWVGGCLLSWSPAV